MKWNWYQLPPAIGGETPIHRTSSEDIPDVVSASLPKNPHHSTPKIPRSQSSNVALARLKPHKAKDRPPSSPLRNSSMPGSPLRQVFSISSLQTSDTEASVAAETPPEQNNIKKNSTVKFATALLDFSKIQAAVAKSERLPSGVWVTEL